MSGRLASYAMCTRWSSVFRHTMRPSALVSTTPPELHEGQQTRASTVRGAGMPWVGLSEGMQAGLLVCKHWLGVDKSTASTALTSCLSHRPRHLCCPWGQGAGSHAGPGSGWGPPCHMWLQRQHTQEQQGQSVKEAGGCAVVSSPPPLANCTQLQTLSSPVLMKPGRMRRLSPLCRGYLCAHTVLCARLPQLPCC